MGNWKMIFSSIDVIYRWPIQTITNLFSVDDRRGSLFRQMSYLFQTKLASCMSRNLWEKSTNEVSAYCPSREVMPKFNLHMRADAMTRFAFLALKWAFSRGLKSKIHDCKCHQLLSSLLSWYEKLVKMVWQWYLNPICSIRAVNVKLLYFTT